MAEQKSPLESAADDLARAFVDTMLRPAEQCIATIKRIASLRNPNVQARRDVVAEMVSVAREMRRQFRGSPMESLPRKLLEAEQTLVRMIEVER